MGPITGTYAGTYGTAKYGLIYIYNIYVQKYGGPPADGGHPAGGGRADTPAGGGQGGAILQMGIRAYAMGEGRIRIRREPQRGGREDVSTRRNPFNLES
jgi:hypothetical protein